MILNYKDVRTWDFVIKRTLKQYWGKKYLVIAKRISQKVESYDDLDSWFSLMPGHFSTEEVTDDILKEITEQYHSVIVYHACKPVTAANYYESGIRPIPVEEVKNSFHDIFASYSTREDRNKAIEDSGQTDTECGVYVGLDDRYLIRHCGHYLIYGGEYLMTLAVNLSSEATLDILRQRGRATIFVCRLPFSYLPGLRRLTNQMLAVHLSRIGGRCKHVALYDHHVKVLTGINPKLIVDYYHPTLIRDPQNWKIWNDRKKAYEEKTMENR